MNQITGFYFRSFSVKNYIFKLRKMWRYSSCIWYLADMWYRTQKNPHTLTSTQLINKYFLKHEIMATGASIISLCKVFIMITFHEIKCLYWCLKKKKHDMLALLSDTLQYPARGLMHKSVQVGQKSLWKRNIISQLVFWSNILIIWQQP